MEAESSASAKQENLSHSSDKGTRSASTRHNLPQIPSLRGKNPRMAVSKSSAKACPEPDQINIVPMEEVRETRRRSSEKSLSPLQSTKKDVTEMPPPNIPTPPTSETMSDECPNTPKTGSSSGSKSPSVSPPTPIKLKIRRSVKRDDDNSASDTKQEQLEFSSVSLQEGDCAAEVGLLESPPSGMGRTKTKGQIKKQLMKKKGQKAETIDPSSGASTPQSEAQEPVIQPAAPDTTTPEATSPKVAPSAAAVVKSPQAVPSDAQWLVGDLLLGRVSGHPFWPCMVAYHPSDSIYTRTIKSYGKSREYHVQFFGNEGERGWVGTNRLIPFEGREPFEKWCAEMRKKHKKDAKIYTVNARRQKAWDVAVKEATLALPMSRQERKQNFTFQYAVPAPVPVAPNGVQEPKKKKTTGKRKLQNILDSSQTGATPPRKRQKRTETAEGSGESDADQSLLQMPEGLADQGATQYMVFCQKKRDLIHREHPGYSLTQISDILARQWSELDDEERSKYIPMGSDVKHLSQIMSQSLIDTGGRSSRAMKPSKKKLEADGSSELYIKKKPKTPVAAERPSRPVLSPSSLDTIDAVLDQVAAGAGTIKALLDKSLIPEDLDDITEEPQSAEPKKKASKKKSEAQLMDFADVETSSHTSSVKEDASVMKWKPPRLPGDNGELDYELEVFRLNNTCNLKKENICHICEKPGDLIQCEGPCNGTYHLACLGLTVPPAGSFRCDECGSGRHTCFVCKESGNSTRRCSVSGCGRYYHEDCIQKFPLTRSEKNNLICPLHTCATCAAVNPKGSKISKGRMYRCVRCPTSYHANDHCIAAGSMNLAGLHIVCSRHFQPLKQHSHHSHINISWCFLCAQGGTLLCCESCPASFHAECLKIQPPNDKWYCSDCARGKRPLYGEIVWGKVGNYRWWPGEICQPKHVPHNIQEKTHQVGEFPMRFFGSHDYYWTHQARVFLFQEGDKGSREKTSASSLAQMFHKAVTEATMAYQLWCKAKEKKVEQEQEKNDRKPAPYKHIKSNYPIGSVQICKADPSELPRCECRPDQDNPCGVDTECLNRMMLYECHPSVCPAGDKCQNQRFTKRSYPTAIPVKTAGRGWGLHTQVNIKKGTFVNEYVGDLVDEAECKRRVKEAHDNDITNFYMLTLDKNRIIDAGPKGNYSRFMNHSCQPNCETQKWNVNGDVRVGLFAAEDILAGSELVFNYNLECLGNEKTVCQCGAPNCSGFLGVRPKTAIAIDTEKKMKDRKRKKKKHMVQKEHEDECYRCAEGGELVMCDKSNCPKVYHLKCLKLAKLPHGKWICPWHHCDECGKRAVKLCSECPNSFCQYHLETNIFQIPDNKLVCADHSDLLNAVEVSCLTMIPNDPTLSVPTSSDVTSESSAVSDGESSACHDDDVIVKPEDVKPVVKAVQDCVKVEGDRRLADVSRRSSRAGSGYSDSDMSEGRLCIVEDPDTTLTTLSPESAVPTSQRKRSRPKKPSPPSASPLLSSGDDVPQLRANSTKSSSNTTGSPAPAASQPKRIRKQKTSDGDFVPENISKKNGSNKAAKGRNSRSSSLLDNKVDSPMFDDDDDFGDLVIDIPTV